MVEDMAVGHRGRTVCVERGLCIPGSSEQVGGPPWPSDPVGYFVHTLTSNLWPLTAGQELDAAHRLGRLGQIACLSEWQVGSAQEQHIFTEAAFVENFLFQTLVYVSF